MHACAVQMQPRCTALHIMTHNYGQDTYTASNSLPGSGNAAKRLPADGSQRQLRLPVAVPLQECGAAYLLPR